MEEPTKKDEATTTEPTKTSSTKTSKGSSKNLIIIGAVVAALIVGALIMKSSNKQSASEKAVQDALNAASKEGVNVNTKDGQVTVTSKDGNGTSTVGTNQKLPTDFPKNDIPYMKEKSVVLVYTNTEEGKKSWSVTTSVDGTAAEANDYFLAKIKTSDYTSKSASSYGDTYIISIENKSYEVLISISGADTSNDIGTQVTYTVQQM